MRNISGHYPLGQIKLLLVILPHPDWPLSKPWRLPEIVHQRAMIYEPIMQVSLDRDTLITSIGVVAHWGGAGSVFLERQVIENRC